MFHGTSNASTDFHPNSIHLHNTTFIKASSDYSQITQHYKHMHRCSSNLLSDQTAYSSTGAYNPSSVCQTPAMIRGVEEATRSTMGGSQEHLANTGAQRRRPLTDKNMQVPIPNTYGAEN